MSEYYDDDESKGADGDEEVQTAPAAIDEISKTRTHADGDPITIARDIQIVRTPVPMPRPPGEADESRPVSASLSVGCSAHTDDHTDDHVKRFLITLLAHAIPAHYWTCVTIRYTL